MTGLDFSSAIAGLRGSMATIPQLAEAIQHGRLADAAACFVRIAEEEKEAYAALRKVVCASG